MTNEHRAQLPAPELAPMKKDRLFFLIALVAAIVTAAYFYYRSEHSASTVQNRNVELEKQLANLSEQLAEIKTAEIYRQDQEQAAKSRLQQAADRAEVTSAAVDVLQQRIDAWNKLLQETETSPTGKRLATDEKLVQQYQAIVTQARPAPRLPNQLRTRLETLMLPIRNALKMKNSAYTPTEQLRSELDAIETEASKAAQLYGEHREQLEAIIARAPATAAPNAPTLAKAIEAAEKKWADQRAILIAEQLENARRENAELDAKAQVENERKLAESKREAQRKIADAQAEKERAEAAIKTSELTAQAEKARDTKRALDEQAKAAQAEAQLEREFERDLPEIRSLLRPFLVIASSQPERNELVRTTAKGPMSLSKLRGTGYLEKTIDAQRALYRMVGNNTHDRELGGFPAYIGGVSDWNQKQDTVQRAQEFLVKYGDLMVKKRMLAE